MTNTELPPEAMDPEPLEPETAAAPVKKRAPAKKRAAKKRAPAKRAVAAKKAIAAQSKELKKHDGTPRKGVKPWGNNSPTGPRMIEAQRKAYEAVDLRSAGMTYSAIAAHLGYTNEGAAYKAVLRALKQSIPETTEIVRTIEVRRLDSMFRALYPAALRGDRLAIDRCLKIMERRAGLLGLDAPLRIQQMVITEEQIREAVEKLRGEVEVLEARSWTDEEGPPEPWDEDDDDDERGPDIAGVTG